MTPDESQPVNPLDLSQVSLLLVDDLKAARLLLRAYLTRMGVRRIEEATDSIEAVRFLTSKSQAPFHAVFISRSMRAKTSTKPAAGNELVAGTELVFDIRQLEGFSNFPIIVVSEDLDPVHRKSAFGVGATDYLLRPYDEATLRELLEKLLVGTNSYK